MEFVSIVVDKLLEYTLIPVAQQVNYVMFYKGNVEELQKQVKRLLRERESLQHRVDDAQRNGEEIEGMVNVGLCEVKENASMAKILLDEDDKRHKRNAEEIEGHNLKWPSDIASKAEELLDEDDKRSKTAWCSSKSFSSMCWRHQISRKAKKLAQEIANIKGEKEFTHVSYRRELNITETWSSSAKNDEAFESRVAALNQILEALADPNLRLIGVHGLGGVGKTILVPEVAIRVKEKSPDTNVVFVDVKQNPKIEKIQQDIADTLGLKLKQQSLVVRATSLRQSLEEDKKKNILVILDDLWEKLDLNEIGITFGKENKNYKILMTSRKRDVLSKMDIQKNFWLKELTEEERKEELAEWRDVLRRLQNHDYDEINRPIVVSYENLKDDCLRSIFVLAGLINSSATIDLFKYCCGLGLFYSMDNLDVRINELKDLCLLQDNDSSKSHFLIHDVVPDTAISIASKDDQFFLKKIEKADEDEWVTDDKLKSCRKMLLDFSNIRELPEGLQCSNLTFFYLCSKDSSLKLRHNFLKGMPKLKVLVLINMTFEFLPSSIRLLRNLHTLCLDECVLENIEGIGELKGLKILSLSGSKFTNLPQEIGKLTKLQLLDLSRCVQLESIPPGVLLNLQMLEVLLMGSSFSKWAGGDQQSTASLAEIKVLRNLNTLAIDVPDQNMLPKEQLFESLHLQRYEVRIGDTWRRFGESKTSRFLRLDLHTGIDTKHYFKSLLDHVGDLHVGRSTALKNVVPDINEKGLIELKHLEVFANYEVQFIADSVDHNKDIFPKLESLDVSSLHLLKLCNGSITERSFSKLKVVKVSFCHKMKSLFSLSLPTCLPHLNEIHVESCEVLEGIVSDDGKIAGPLQFAELRTLTLDCLRSLIGFYSEDKKSYEAQQKKPQLADDNILDPPVVLFSHKVGKFLHIELCLQFPALENGVIVECPKLKLFSKRAPNKTNLRSVKDSKLSDAKGYWEDDLNSTVQKLYTDKLYYELWDLNLSDYPELKQIWHTQLPDGAFCNLHTLTLSNCESSSKVLQWNVLKCLVNLEELKVEFCKSIEVVFDLEGAKDGERDYILAMEFFSTLTLTSLPNLKHIWNKDPQEILDFPKLTGLKLVDVPKLDHSLVEKVIVNLELSRLVVDETIMTWFRQFLINHFNSLEVLGLQFLNYVNIGFPYDVLQKMSNLRTLIVKDGLFEEIFPFRKQVVEGNHSGVVQLIGLWLENLQKLRHICEKGYDLDPSLKNLKVLYIEECSCLLNLGPSSLTFNLLKLLRVKKCEQLLYLMTPSTAKSLDKLKYLIIEDCSMIKEIILGRGVDAQTIHEITFSRLDTLMLKNLPCLESFCSMNSVFNFPSLGELVIWQCPNLKKFSNGVPSTPNLKPIVGESGDLLEFDLNSTGEKMYKYEIVSEDYFFELDINEDSLLDWGIESENEQLNESDRNHQFEVEEEDKVEEQKEHKEEKEENINGCVTEQSTISCPECRDINLQASTNEDITLSTPLLAISQEYRTSGKGGSQKKIEDMNVIEQSTSSYSESMEAHQKQTQEFEISISNFDAQSMGETTNIDDDKGLPLEILTEATSSLDSIIEEPMSEQVLMGRQEGLEQNQVTIEFLDRTDVIPEAVHNAIELINSSVSIVSTSKELQGLGRCSPISQPFSSIANAAVSPRNMPSGLDLSKSTDTIIDFPKMTEDSYQGPRNEGRDDHPLDNLDIEAGPSVPVDDLPTDLNLNNKRKQWDNFDSCIGPSCSLEVKPIEVVQSTQDCQESDSSKSNSFLQTQIMTRHAAELQAKEIHQESKKPRISPTNKGESAKERAEFAQKDPTARKLELPISPLAHEENKASKKLQLLATNSHLSPISRSPPANSYLPLGHVTEASGSFPLPSIIDTTATSSPITSLLEDLLSRLHLLLSSEDMSYLCDGFSRYPWALNLLESWSDKCWNWSYFVIFARVLCILQTTTAANLSEALYAELSSSLITLGNVGFDANWIAAVHTRISDCQVSLTSFHEAKALRDTKDAIASRLIEFESLVDAMRAELAGIDNMLAKYAHKEELARNVIGLP
ncbi:hypothetical protein L6164_003155 [Bauhinia variegata]|uniref:Uncharacterized protein n=1 Tax=Bauhinia variegata TaxID=167791 RepID=A0ACB9Q1Z0_BAUVA|nr:hypothetical protein L6164_003155 [Bauhinia variegata]